MRKAVVEKLNASFETYPLVSDGFVSEDYAKSVGIGSSTARERLRKLLDDGVVRRVRIKRSGAIRQGWQLVEKRA